MPKGTFEALTHEAAFATTFSLSPSTSADIDKTNTTETNIQRLTQWHEFAASILFSIPFVVGRQIFEVEFLRCCSYLVSGTEDSIRDHEKSRVRWLANEYLRYHGQAMDLPAWNEWKQETIPGVDLIAQAHTPSGMATSSSTQAILHPSPALGSVATFPNVKDTFSPRPEEAGKTTTLLEALFPPVHEIRGYDKPLPIPRLAQPANRFPWAALREEGLTRDILFRLDPFLVARSLRLFHRSVLEQCPDNITFEFIITPEGGSDGNQDFASSPISPSPALSSSSPLFGSDEQPHWLTKLLLVQILGTETPSRHVNNYANGQPTSPGRRSEDRGGGGGGGQTSRTHSRSELISLWARVGEICRLAGDETSWRAIFAALCSRPVARLDKAWKRVNLQAVAIIEGWAHGSDGAGMTTSVAQPQVDSMGR